MRYGFYLPTRGPNAQRDALSAFARKGEAVGFDSVMIADHVVFPVQIDSKYPYTVGGAFPGQGDAMDQLALMSFVAGVTEKLRLVTSVMVVPHRNPVLTAKMLATIDVLSNGRVTVGCGVGWLREEFEALHTAPFDKRGRVTDEYLEIFKTLWTGSPASYEGEFYSFPPVRCEPLPIQKPHPPIWIGGHSKAALRRTAKYGDGWHPVGAIAAVPLPPDELKAKLDELKRLTDAEGRDFDKITISYKTPLYDPGMPVPGADRKPFTGSREQMLDDIAAFAKLGVSELIFDFRAESVSSAMEKMEQFSAEIMKHTR